MGRVNSASRTGRQTKKPPVTDDFLLAELQQKFVEFRAQNARFTQIPETLRDAVFDALERGIPPAAVQQNCGVTPKQVRQWRKERQQVAEDVDGGEGTVAHAVAECFTVVPADEDNKDARTREPLELRVGSWAITIRDLSY